MYQINKESNNITKLEEMRFSDLGFKEREHLQEWIAKNPEVLGEELLIIQKEFDGFNDTNERLDLLALDKDSNIVVIENKLDDSGRDVTWQALKYTSYCSTLTTSQIIKMFQDYLDRYSDGEDAKDTIIEFLGIKNEENLLLNRNDQRIMFVANNYRKEVTSTVLWLINHDINIQCFKATPYRLDNELFLQIDQIIPVPEVEEFMIDAKEKQKEEKTKGAVATETERILLKFWKTFKSDLEHHNIHFYDRITPPKRFYMGFSKGKGRFVCTFGKDSPRVELYFTNDPDKKLFDAMYTRKDELESSFGKEIVWERLDGKLASRIKHDMPSALDVGEWGDEEWEQSKIKWFRETLISFYTAVNPIWEKAQKEL